LCDEFLYGVECHRLVVTKQVYQSPRQGWYCEDELLIPHQLNTRKISDELVARNGYDPIGCLDLAVARQCSPRRALSHIVDYYSDIKAIQFFYCKTDLKERESHVPKMLKLVPCYKSIDKFMKYYYANAVEGALDADPKLIMERFEPSTIYFEYHEYFEEAML